jgi:hypothetical protein
VVVDVRSDAPPVVITDSTAYERAGPWGFAAGTFVIV